MGNDVSYTNDVNYTLEIMFDTSQNPLPAERVELTVEDTFTTALGLRHGVKTEENPEKTSDEIPRFPVKSVNIPDYISKAGAEIVQKKRFTPEWLMNLQSFDVAFDGLVVHIGANKVNYGALPVLRELVKIFPADEMQSVLNQIAPMAVRAVLVSRDNGMAYLARRKNVEISGGIETFPAGTEGEDDSPLTALKKEAWEEAGIKIGVDGTTASFLGIGRGRTEGPNPNLFYLIETPLTLEQLFEQIRRNTNTKEHDKFYGIPWDEQILTECIVEDFVRKTPDHAKMPDVSVLSLLFAGGADFGPEWLEDTKNELLSLKEPSFTIIDTPAASKPALAHKVA